MILTIAALVGYVLWFVPPSVELVWIDASNGLPVASRLPAERWMPTSIADLYRHRARLPLQLGIRNRSWLPLYDVVVTLHYPHLQVHSTARALATEDSTVMIQHKLPGLLAGDAFTPLDDVDQVLIPMDSILVGAVTLDGAGIPQYIEMTSEKYADTSSVTLGFVARVSALGRLRQCAEQLTVPMWLEQRSWWPPPIRMKERPATPSEHQEFARLATAAMTDTVFGGALSTRHTNRRIRWTCFKGEFGRVALYSVDGRPVRMQADTNSDWLVDYELLARPASGGAVTVTYYALPRPMDLPFIHTKLRPALPRELMVPESQWTLRR
jgi:hypothetical protein